MSTYTERLLRSILMAKAVNHYYWIHTDGDGDDGKVSIENIIRIVERMKRITVKRELAPFEAVNVRGIYERYGDHVEILVREDQTVEWYRFIAIKELAHALTDSEDEFSPDGVSTIRQLVKYRGISFDGQETGATRSERFAEFVALELIYPFEHREGDKAQLDSGEIDLPGLVEKRGVPSSWIERALDPEHLKNCAASWKLVSDQKNFPPLAKLADE